MSKHLPPATNLTDPVHILVKVRQALKDPDHWVKEKMIVTRLWPSDVPGSLMPKSKHVEKVCLTGAVQRYAELKGPSGKGLVLGGESPSRHARDLLIEAITQYRNRGQGVEAFNDSKATTHADIMAVLDLGIQIGRAKRKGKRPHANDDQ